MFLKVNLTSSYTERRFRPLTSMYFNIIMIVVVAWAPPQV